jgi:hypothetical protein
VAIIKRTPPPPVPFCIIAKIAHGSLRTQRVPEAQAAWLARDFGWSILIRDTEMPAEAHVPWMPQSNPKRVDDEADHDGA